MAALLFTFYFFVSTFLIRAHCQQSRDTSCLVNQLFNTVNKLSQKVEECCQSFNQNKQSIEVFYLFASPSYIANHSSFLQPTFVTNISNIRFPPFQRRRGKLFQLPLIEANKLHNSVRYIITITFWKTRVTTNNDVQVALCDSSRCFGFNYYEKGGLFPIEWNDTSDRCFLESSSDFGVDLGLQGEEQIWEINFEVSPGQDMQASTLSPVFSRAVRGTYRDGINPSLGLWLTVCRDQATEQHDLRYFEITVRKT
ncbi:uncharacterized protein LOC134188045 [Corticium candelabrum]|uniref:uncharacterized protein LOC134188045 n=1 Tax=Corticium candelabrum TaxID=121492 RepID=UPI002E26352E|nr:uncharacterized protein LOC134188045 [Corticium candelabrum]